MPKSKLKGDSRRKEASRVRARIAIGLVKAHGIALIEVAGQWLLIGVTQTSMTTLAQIEAPAIEEKEDVILFREITQINQNEYPA